MEVRPYPQEPANYSYYVLNEIKEIEYSNIILNYLGGSKTRQLNIFLVLYYFTFKIYSDHFY